MFSIKIKQNWILIFKWFVTSLTKEKKLTKIIIYIRTHAKKQKRRNYVKIDKIWNFMSKIEKNESKLNFPLSNLNFTLSSMLKKEI